MILPQMLVGKRKPVSDSEEIIRSIADSLPLSGIQRLPSKRKHPVLVTMILPPITALLILVFQGVSGSECNPGFADSCFTAVTGDLNYMLNLKDSVARNISQDAVHDLCLALDDCLDCTTDIIDEDCSKDEGRDRLDSWIKALRGAYDYVCKDNHKILKDILRGIQCWSIDEFLLCSEEFLKLTHIGDLLHTNIDEVECKNIQKVTNECYQQARTGSCREQDDISAEVGMMLTAFYRESSCRRHELLPSDGISRTPLQLLLYLLVTSVLLL